MRDPSVSEAVDQPQLSIFATNHYATVAIALGNRSTCLIMDPCSTPVTKAWERQRSWIMMDTIDSVGLGGQPLDDKVEEEIPRL